MILCDDREVPSGIPEMLRSPHTVQRLTHGDYAWYDKAGRYLLIERKSTGDFLSSARDGRLASVESLREASDVAFMLLEGFPLVIDGKVAWSGGARKYRMDTVLMPYRKTRWGIASVLGLQWSIIYGAGVIPLFTGDAFQTACLLDAAWRSSQKESFTWGGLLPNQWVSDRVPPTQQAYRGFEGIGPKLAAALYECYPTMRQLCAAKLADLIKVPGLGTMRAKRLFSFLRGKNAR